jgi:hypothetical protein
VRIQTGDAAMDPEEDHDDWIDEDRDEDEDFDEDDYDPSEAELRITESTY